MTFSLRRTSDAEDLLLTREHEALVQPRKGAVRWADFDLATVVEADRLRAVEAWRARAFTEMHSLALFTQLTSQVHLLGAPLDWSGALARAQVDEVRHTDLCLKLLAALGDPEPVTFEAAHLHLPVEGRTLRAHVRRTIVSAFCIGETVSGRMFKRCLAAATVPLAREVVTAIIVDESFHGELGWELGALLMRPCEGFEEERAELAQALPELFAHFARQCCVTRGPEWTAAQPEVEPGENFGTLSDAGYARAFFEGMEADVVPGLCAIGLPEAVPHWLGFVASLP